MSEQPDPALPPPPPSLSLLRTLNPPTTGNARAWQSIAHPDPSTPLLATASADKTVNVWSLRDFSLVSTISGGHKRSVRAVGWKDFGRSSRSNKEKKPVVLGTGSFDANVGIWVWNDERRAAAAGLRGGEAESSAIPDEIDMTRDEDEDEDWHFSTLLTGPDSEIKSIDFAPSHYSMSLLATSSRDKSVWIWEEVEPEEWETIAVLSEHTGDVKCVSWCTGAERGNGRRSKRRKLANGTGTGPGTSTGDGDVDMENAQMNGTRTETDNGDSSEGGRDDIIGSRDILASGSYDDTIRLWRDVEDEGDWICVGVIDSHKGTVWDLKWEGHINYSLLDLSHSPAGQSSAIAEFEADWDPRIVSCSDDLTVRVWRRELSEAEREKRNQSRASATAAAGVGAPMGFASSRLPSVIRPTSAMERWVEDATLPAAHVRSVYAVDWSRTTGLVVSCGGDGAIVVYREIPAPEFSAGADDVVMNGTGSGNEPYRLRRAKWVVVATIEAAHDEYEINHVCWATRRDSGIRFDGEEVIVSTGDDGVVRVWTLPEGVGGPDEV